MPIGLGRVITGAFAVGQRVCSGRVLVVCHKPFILRQWHAALTALLGSRAVSWLGHQGAETPVKLLLSEDSSTLKNVGTDYFKHIIVEENKLPATADYARDLQRFIGTATILGLTPELQHPSKAHSKTVAALYGPPTVELTLAQAVARGYLRPLDYVVVSESNINKVTALIQESLKVQEPSSQLVIFPSTKDSTYYKAQNIGGANIVVTNEPTEDRNFASARHLILVDSNSLFNRTLARAIRPDTADPLRVLHVVQSPASVGVALRFAKTLQDLQTERSNFTLTIDPTVLRRGSKGLTTTQAIAQVRAVAAKHGKPPSVKVFNEDPDTVSANSVLRAFNTYQWNTVLHAAGLELVREYRHSTAELIATYFDNYDGENTPKGNLFTPANDLPYHTAYKRLTGATRWADVHERMLKLRGTE